MYTIHKININKMYAPRCIKSGTIDITELFRLAVHNSINAFPVKYFTTKIFSSNISPLFLQLKSHLHGKSLCMQSPDGLLQPDFFPR